MSYNLAQWLLRSWNLSDVRGRILRNKIHPQYWPKMLTSSYWWAATALSTNPGWPPTDGTLPYLNVVPKILMGPRPWAQGPRWGYMVARRRGEHRVTSSATGAVLKAWPQATPTLSIVSITYTNFTHGYCISISVSIKYSQHHSTPTIVSISPSKI